MDISSSRLRVPQLSASIWEYCLMGITLKDVANQAGVNVATASRALSADKQALVKPATRLRVLEAANALGYRGNLQASALRRGRTGTIGVVVADLSNPFVGPVLRGIANALSNRDLLPIMIESRDSSEELATICDKLLAQRVDGLIVAAGRYRDRALLRRVADEVPLVLAVRELPGSGIRTVAHDDVAGGRLAAEHLLSLGHRHVAQLIGPQDISSFAARRRGFREVVEAADGECIDVDAAVHLPTFDAGEQLATALLARSEELPTALFAHNDSIAVGAIETMRASGLECPGEISVVGFNDVPLSDRVRVPLTTIGLPGYELGRLAAELVSSDIEGTEPTTEKVMLAPELVVRESTAAPRNT